MNTFCFSNAPRLLLAVALAGVATRLGAVDLVTGRSAGAKPSASAHGASGFPSISKDGRWATFASSASDLAPEDNNGAGTDVFLADLETKPAQIQLLSAPTAPVAGRGDSHSGVLARNGAYIVFVSTDACLTPGAGPDIARIYRRDLRSNAVTLVSTDATGGMNADGDSGEPQVSEDGRFVCFTSAASNLVAGDDNNRVDLFLRDVELGTTLRILADGGDASGRNTGLRGFQMSGDGRTIVFSYLGAELAVSNRPTAPTSVYVWRLGEGLVGRVGLPGIPGPGYTAVDAFNLALSGDGTVVVFTTPGIPESSLPEFPGGVVRADIPARITTVLSAAPESRSVSNIDDAFGAAINWDGSRILFRGGGSEGATLMLWSKATGYSEVTSGLFNGAGIPAQNIVLSDTGLRAVFLAPTNGTPAASVTPLQLFTVDLDTSVIRLLSRNPKIQPAGGAEEANAAISGDGGRIVFASRSPELVADDRNGASDIFLYDWRSNTIELLSHARPDLTELTVTRLAGSAVRGVSADARRILLESYDTTVQGDVPGAVRQFLVKDLDTGETLLPSASTNGVTGTRYGVESGLISGNGRYVAFTSTALDLVPNESAGMHHAYIRDLLTGEIVIATRRTDPSLPRYRFQRIDLLQLSSEGRFLLLRTTDPSAFDLSAPAGTQSHVLYDRTSNSLTAFRTYLPTGPDAVMATHAPVMAIVQLGRKIVGLSVLRLELGTGQFEESPPPNALFNGMLLSADGRRIVVYTRNRDQAAIFYRDPGMQTFASVPLPDALRVPIVLQSLSYDGAFALVETTNAVLRLHIPTGVAEPCVFDAAGQPMLTGSSSRAAMDLWGETVVLQQRPSAGGNTGDLNLYATHMSQHRTEILTQGSDATPADALSTRPFVNADGSRTVFTSWAGNLVPNDANDAADVYTAVLSTGPGVDSDSDGLDDAWELTWFGTLASDGTADVDGDGVPNAGEAVSGTVPIDGGSVLQAALQADSTGKVRVTWPTAKGRTYGLRYQTQLGAAWVELPEVIAGTGNRVEWSETKPDAAERFYQVVVRKP